MSVLEQRLAELIRKAPESTERLFELLTEGLDWPTPGNLEPEDILLDWSPDEFHLDPDKLAKLRTVQQVSPLVSSQTFGVFLLQFDGDRLPLGAIRRLVSRLVRRERSSANPATHPVWELNDLLLFCQSAGSKHALHIVALRDIDDKRILRTMSWDTDITAARLSLLMSRGIADLRWTDTGPAISTDLSGPASGFGGYRQTIKTAKSLASHMAAVAQGVRDEVLALYEVETEDGRVRTLFTEVRTQLLGNLTPERFADVYAQTMVYGLLTARLARPDEFKAEQSVLALKFDNEFLDAIYSRFRDQSDGVIDIDELGLNELAEQLAMTDVDELLADFGTDNQRDDPVVYFYEEFLAEYDPQQRKDLGAFYTPLPVVRYIVKTVDDALKTFGLPLGVADPTTWAEYVTTHPDIDIPNRVEPDDAVVSMFDPANGTGTFLVEWLRQGRRNDPSSGEAIALSHASACEISLASYAVSHLKVSLDISPGLREEARLPIYLGDTLGAKQSHVFEGLADPISTEGAHADKVKYDWNHNVLIGNPPYDRDASSKGGFVLAPGADDRSLFDDILEDAKNNVIFSHTKSLNDLYVYFWRWAVWKTFEVNTGPAVISMITSSSWLAGPGFLGLRRLVREFADQITVVDLGGAGRGARKEENVFDIQTPVAIVTLVRSAASDRSTPAHAHYIRVTGSRAEKLAFLEELTTGAKSPPWITLDSNWFAPLTPPTGGDDWQAYVAVADLFPWQQPGCQFGRTSPIAPSPAVLERRWKRFVGTTDLIDRAKCFNASKTGRNIYTKVAGLPRLSDEAIGSTPPPIVRYAYRSFDRQWAFEDPRWAKTESPALWWSATPQQIFLTSMMTNKMSRGPAATITTAVPDFHYFCGRGGKDVVPLYRDATGTPNADPAALDYVSQVLGMNVTVERLFAYTFGVLAGSDYTERFHEELETPGPRVPLTADPGLFERMAQHGEKLIWLQTFGERFGAAEFPTTGTTWTTEPSRLPEAKTDIKYNSATEALRIADGVLTGVPEDAWSFEVSGMQVIPKWLGYRMAKPAGRAASSTSPLDHIRPATWSPEWSTELVEIVAAIKETLARLPEGNTLLDEIVAGPLIPADALPPVPDALRKPPSSRTAADPAQGAML